MPFAAAIREIARRKSTPTNLSSAELSKLGESFWRDALASARTTQASLLDDYKDLVGQVLNPRTEIGADGAPRTVGMDRAKLRLKIKQHLAGDGYQPEEGEAGTIKDLSSNRRINLVQDFWTKYGQAKGQTVRNNDADLLWSHPAYELVRTGDRQEKRNWIEIWRGAGGTVYPGRPPGLPLNPDMVEGRCIARKDDPIWFEISEFGRAEPPYRFGSGVGRAAVRRKVCIELGVIEPDEQVGPTPMENPNPEEGEA